LHIAEQATFHARAFQPRTIKQFATGKGNVSKLAMIQAIKAKGFKPEDDNQADAIALLLRCESVCPH
jgi:Holliday junction resolvasome RuvABC endonuclease subunit